MSNIMYTDRPEELKLDDAFFVETPNGVSNKEELLNKYAERLHFPDYFGNNWDALEDLLKQLYWIKQDHVIIYHHDLPQLDNDDIQIFLSILDSAAVNKPLWAEEESRIKLGYKAKQSVRFVFPKKLKEKIEHLIPTKEEWDNFLVTRKLPKKI